MKILVTGGTGVVGKTAVRTLHARGHSVRVLTRHAGRGETWWPDGVEGWAGDITNEKSIRGSGDSCHALLHLAGIATEQPPRRTFQSVNIDGTRYMVLEAERSGIRKIVYVSSLGADRGHTSYHASKCVAEDVVRAFSRDWVVLRPGAVYGPGDAHISVILWAVRSLPIVPTVGDGTQPFQPIWHEDFAKAMAMTIEREDIRCRVLELAGTELTSQNDLVARLRTITGRAAPQAPLPELIASWGLRALDALGLEPPIGESQLGMLADGNVIGPSASNSLTDEFGIAPTRLDDGLRRLAEEQPEQLPRHGVGELTRKRFWVDIRASRYDADALFEYVRSHFAELMPSVVRVRVDSTALTRLEEGTTLTLDLPLRGQAQVRVREVSDRRLTLITVAGHPLAGAVRLLVEPRDDLVRFEIQVYQRPATVIDELLMRVAGDWLQRESWSALARNVVRASGGSAGDVQRHDETLDAHESSVIDAWAATLSGGSAGA